MSKSVRINDVTYENVPSVEIPLSSGGGNAEFFDISDADAVASDIISGKSAYGSNGKISGSMANNGAVSGTISTKEGEYTVPAGYHNGSGKVGIASAEKAKLVSGNIRAGQTILGVSGKSTVVDTDDADATASAILSGKSAYVNGQKINGTLTTVSVSQDSTTKILTIS